MRPPRLCQYPRCPEPAVGSYCKKHGPQPSDAETAKRDFRKKRLHSRARGYTRAWERIRKSRIGANPICQVDGCLRIVEEVDHIVPLGLGGTNTFENSQSLCKQHHAAKSARDREDIARSRQKKTTC